jgi:hypothetical protein
LATISRPRYPAAETGVGDHSLKTTAFTGPVSCTGAFRKPKGAQLRDVAGIFTLRSAPQSLRILHPTCLPLFHRPLRGGRFLRATIKTRVYSELLSKRQAGLGNRRSRQGGFRNMCRCRGKCGSNLGNFEVGQEGCREFRGLRGFQFRV